MAYRIKVGQPHTGHSYYIDDIIVYINIDTVLYYVLLYIYTDIHNTGIYYTNVGTLHVETFKGNIYLQRE